MNEHQLAKCIANRVLDQHWEDPDSEISILARQFLGACERRGDGTLVLKSKWRCAYLSHEHETEVDAARCLSKLPYRVGL